MSAFKSSLQASNALGVLREVSTQEKRFVCFTAYSEADAQWLIGASDGVDVWRIGLTEQDLEEHSKARGLSTHISTIRHTLESGEVQLLPQTHGQLTVCLKCPSEQFEFTLFELSAAERRAAHKALVFSVWDQLVATQGQLTECQRQLQEAQKPVVHDAPVFADVSMRGSKAAAKPKKPAGHSIVNPSSKRRKAATGVVFGDDDS